MGIYSANRTGLGYYSDAEVPVDESYVGTIGCYNALIDMERNNHAIFENFIARDFEEATMVYEGAHEDDLIAFTEASLGGFFQSFKAMIMKIWEKIKGIFSTFLKKLDSVIIRDNKKYVDKYQKEVRTKNLSKMKYKVCKYAKEDGLNELKKKLGENNATFTTIADEAVNIIADSAPNFDKIKKLTEDGDYESYVIEQALGSKFKSVELNELAKEIHDYCFDSEESEEGLKTEDLTQIILVLRGDKTKSEIEKAQRQTNKHFSNVLKTLDKYAKDLSKVGKDTDAADYVYGSNSSTQKSSVPKGDTNRASELLKRAGVAQTAVNQVEVVHNRVVACFLNEHKFDIKQSRRIFSKAVAYNDKAKNESVLLDAIEETAGYEIDMMFDDYSLEY